MSSEENRAIKAFWEERSLSDRSTSLVTINDVNQRLLENEIVLKYLPIDQRVLDVGCGNGFSTAVFSKHAKEIYGIDYSESMIARAKNEYGDIPNAIFNVMNVLDLDLKPSSFDVAISQRCLINLSTWDDQKKAISNIAKVVRPGGTFIIQEGTQQGRRALNRARTNFGLSFMPDVPYNLDFDEDLLWPYIQRFFQIVEIRRFGLYDLISRIVHPLLVAPDEPKYEAKINEIAKTVTAEMDGLGEISREFSGFLRRIA